jgi:hypothetical protein
MSERIKLAILSALLLLVLAFSVFAMVNTENAVRALQVRNHEVRTGNVSTIRSWMTIPAISHIYHVPEDYMYRSLDITHPAPYHHVTLYEIANHKQQPVDQVIQTLQHVILLYRKQHPSITLPLPMKYASYKVVSPARGRAKS